MNESTATRKRPLQSRFSSFYIIYAAQSLLTFDLADSSVIPTPAGQPDIIIEISAALNHFFTIIGIGIALAAALALFFLKKAAFYLYTVNLGLSIVFIIRALTTARGIDFNAIFNFNFDAALIFAAVFILIVGLIPFLYGQKLKQKGILR